MFQDRRDPEPTIEDIETWKDRIFSMSQVQLASLQRFAKPGHMVFANVELYKYFQEKFRASGGMTPEISKVIGW